MAFGEFTFCVISLSHLHVSAHTATAGTRPAKIAHHATESQKSASTVYAVTSRDTQASGKSHHVNWRMQKNPFDLRFQVRHSDDIFQIVSFFLEIS